MRARGRQYKPSTPDDALAPRQVSIRLTQGQTVFVAAVAAAEFTSPSAVIRRFLTYGIHEHQKQQQRLAEHVDG